MLKHFTDILVAFGPWGIFLLNFIDSLGMPLPAATDVLLIGVAAASAKTPGNAYFAAFMAVLGSMAGNIGLFLAARQGRRWFSQKPAQPEGSPQRFRAWFYRYGLLTVFVPAVVPFVPLPLKVFVISAGAMHTPLGKFFVVILAARAIRYFGEAYLGLQLGEDAQGFLTRNGWLLLGIVVTLVLALYWAIRLKDGRRNSGPGQLAG